MLSESLPLIRLEGIVGRVKSLVSQKCRVLIERGCSLRAKLTCTVGPDFAQKPSYRSEFECRHVVCEQQ